MDWSTSVLIFGAVVGYALLAAAAEEAAAAEADDEDVSAADFAFSITDGPETSAFFG